MRAPDATPTRVMTFSDARHYFGYDNKIGHLIWKNKPPYGRKVIIGATAGYIGGTGTFEYGVVSVEKVRYLTHRLVWLWHHGEMPPGFIDHINGIKSDNRVENLRLATKSQNAANAKKPAFGTNRLKGAHWYKKHGQWASKIRHNGKAYNIGMFKTEIEAHEAYCKKASELFGEFARVA